MTQLPTSDEIWEVEIEHESAMVSSDPTAAYLGYLAWKPARYSGEPGHDFTDPEWVPATWTTSSGRYFLNAKPNVTLATSKRWHVFAGLSGPGENVVKYAGEREVA